MPTGKQKTAPSVYGTVLSAVRVAAWRAERRERRGIFKLPRHFAKGKSAMRLFTVLCGFAKVAVARQLEDAGPPAWLPASHKRSHQTH